MIGRRRTAQAWALAAGMAACCAVGAGQDAAQRATQLSAAHADSLDGFCLAVDGAVLQALPGWSDPAVRWALLGVPTDAERSRLKRRVAELSELVNALEPVVERRLREADGEDGEGIEAAVQLTEVLLPLARARGLLLYGAAVDPAIDRNPESRRALEEAINVAGGAESVSAWSDAERGLIVALAALRLGDQERSLEAVGEVRRALREDAELGVRTPELVSALRAAETLLVAIARSVSDARSALPEDEQDRERLRIRLAAMAAERATSNEQRDLLLRAEADRLANRALDEAIDGTLADIDWMQPLERSTALVGASAARRLGGGALAASVLVQAGAAEGPAGVRRVLEGENLGSLSVLGDLLELRVMVTAGGEEAALDHVIRIGTDLHRLAGGRAIAPSALGAVADLLRVGLGAGTIGARPTGDERDRLLDLLDDLVGRDDLGRSNLDLLARVLLPGEADSPAATSATIDAAQTLASTVERTGAGDTDSTRAMGLVGATLLDRIARNQAAPLLGGQTIDREREHEGVRLLRTLGERLGEMAPDADADEHTALHGLSRAMLALHECELGDSARAAELLDEIETDFVAQWIVAMTRTRAALRSGSDVDGAGDPNGRLLGAGVFAERDVDPGLDMRNGLNEQADSFDRAPGALRAGVLLSGRGEDSVHRAIRCFSAALRSDDRALLGELARAAEDGAASAERRQHRAWLRIISAEALRAAGDEAASFAVLREIVAATDAEDRAERHYWHASLRMLEILSAQNADGSRSAPIAREIRRLKLQPSWGVHEDICDAISAVTRSLDPGSH